VAYEAALLLAAIAAPCHAAGDAAGDEAHAYGGLSTDLPFWGILAFVGFLVAIKFLGWDSLTSNMKLREEHERGLIKAAEQTRREADEERREHLGRLEAVDEEIREVVDEAHRDAAHTREDILSVARHEADVYRQRALTEISRARDQALDEIFNTLTDRVTDATQQRLVTRLTTTDQNRLIEEALASLTTQRA
jgi:F-type H+-transporting ATPase subunit b